MFRAPVTISDFAATRYYGVVLSTVYIQAIGVDPVFFAVLDVIPTENGIVWHKTSGVGRIHYCYYYEPSAGQYRIKVNILKNSDDT